MKFKDGIAKLKDHSTIIFTGFTCIGVIATAVLAIKAGPKLKEIKETRDTDSEDILLEDSISPEEKKKQLKDINKKARKDSLKELAPTIAVATITICSAVLTESVNRKEVKEYKDKWKDAVIAYNILEKKHIDFKEKAKEIVGKGKVTKIEDEVRTEEAKKYFQEKDVTIYDTGTGNELFYDVDGASAFYASTNFVEEARIKFNDEVISSGAPETDQREWYYHLTLPEPQLAKYKVFCPGHLMQYSITHTSMPINGVTRENVHVIEVCGQYIPQYDDKYI